LGTILSPAAPRIATGVSHRVLWSSNIGFGVSTFFAYRSHYVNIGNTAQGLNESGQGAVAVDTRDISFDHLRLLWKIGLSGEWYRWKLGLSVTTPGVGLFGSGTRRLDQTLVSTIPDPEGNTIARVATDTQEVDSTYKSPFSLGIGCARRFGATYLHFSTEWFAPVSEYKVLDVQPFIDQSTGEVIDAVPYGQLDHVINFAVGVEHQLNADFQLYGGFNTDFSGTKEDARATLNFPAIDLYHFSGGAIFRIGSSEFTLGATYATGDTGTRERQPGQILPNDVSINFQRLTMVIGLNLPF